MKHVSTTVAGVDGCRAGWITVVWGPDGLTARLASCWQELALDDASLVGVDMPIGLSDRGPRACDIAARQRLPRGRKSSVFPSPRRYMLGHTWAEANAQGKAREGVGLSRQSGQIAGKIAELDAALTPADQDRIREVHPELVFQGLNGADPLPAKKRTAGRAARLHLLESAGMRGLDGLLGLYPRRTVQPDDLLDAAACALAARRMAEGRAERLPAGTPCVDSRGLRMEIWF